MFAVSLAGSLFFSISPTAAKDKVLLYLLLTMGPFAVVAPALGPAHRPQPGRPPGDGGGLGPRAGGALPVPGPGHPLAAAVPRGLRHAGPVQGLPGDQRGPGSRDGRLGHAGRGTAAPPGAGRGRGPPTDPPASPRPRSDRAAGPPSPTARGPDPTPPYGTPVIRSRGSRHRRAPRSSRTWPRSTPGSACWPRCPASPSPCRPWLILKLGGRRRRALGRHGGVRGRGRGRGPAARARRLGRELASPAHRGRSRPAPTDSTVHRHAGRRRRRPDGPGLRPDVGRGRRGPGRLPPHRRHRGASWP